MVTVDHAWHVLGYTSIRTQTWERQRRKGTKWFPFSRATVSCTGAVCGPSTQPESEFNSSTRTQKSPLANSAGGAALLEEAAPGLCAMARIAAFSAAVQWRKILSTAASQCAVHRKLNAYTFVQSCKQSVAKGPQIPRQGVENSCCKSALTSRTSTCTPKHCRRLYSKQL